ncbi:hypothetical protein LCGC14_2845400 [marine sediment metagenome]|uniref:Transmembrane protein n=1 Tax=marine sediment metagenome TaxID=412755 RepID=A0A0F8YWL8_9ZZZZ
MKKLLLIFMFGIFLISMVSATERTWGTVQQRDCIILTQTCDNCSFSNITSIQFPNKTSYAINEETIMTKSGTKYNYTYCGTDSLGQHIVTGHGDDDGIDTTWIADFEVTQTGDTLSTSESIIYSILFLGVLFFFLLCLYGGIVLPFSSERNEEGKIISVQKLKYFKLSLLFLSYLLFVWLTNLLFALANNFNILTSYANFFSMIFTILNSLSYVIFVVMFVAFMFLAWKDLQLKKLLQRGLNPD